MSIVANYARLSAAELALVKAAPPRLWDLPDMSPDAAEASSELLYLDKTWEALSWLCSDVGRAEARNLAAQVRASRNKRERSRFGDDFELSVAAEARAMGFEFVSAELLPPDPVLTAIQGRPDGDDGPQLDVGESAAGSIFPPHEVLTLLAVLDALDPADLLDRFDIDEMTALNLPCDGDESELEEFILPALESLKTLYERAARAGQHVVVVLG